MKDALHILFHQLRLPAKSRDIWIGVAAIVVMTVAMAVLEFTHRAWVLPAIAIFGIFAVAQLIVYLILLQRRTRRVKREQADDGTAG